jgi:hypothetical protein
VRIAIEVLGLQPDLDQHLHGALAALGERHVGIEQQRFHQNVADLLAGIERAIGVLEDDLHLAAHLAGDAGPADIDGDAIHEQFARGLPVDQGQDARQRRLARAALADDGEGPAPVEREAEVLHRMNDAAAPEQGAADMIVARDVARLEHRTHWATRSSGC